jgi:hypothetical protein
MMNQAFFIRMRDSNRMEGVDTRNRTVFIIIEVGTSNFSTEKSLQ